MSSALSPVLAHVHSLETLPTAEYRGVCSCSHFSSTQFIHSTFRVHQLCARSLLVLGHVSKEGRERRSLCLQGGSRQNLSPSCALGEQNPLRSCLSSIFPATYVLDAFTWSPCLSGLGVPVGGMEFVFPRENSQAKSTCSSSPPLTPVTFWFLKFSLLSCGLRQKVVSVLLSRCLLLFALWSPHDSC